MDWDRIENARNRARSIFAITFVAIALEGRGGPMALPRRLSGRLVLPGRHTNRRDCLPVWTAHQ